MPIDTPPTAVFGLTLPQVHRDAMIGGSVAASAAGASSFFDVAAYGALGNGSTNDTTAVNAAITAANLVDGGIVYLRNTGDPYMVSTILMKDRVTLVGESQEVMIQKIAGTTGPVITTETTSAGGFRTGFVSLIIDGNRANCPSGTDGIGQHPSAGSTEGYKGSGLLVRDVTIQNCLRDGLRIGITTANVVLCRVENLWATGNGGRGANLIRWTDGWFLTSWLAENGAGAMRLFQSGAVRIYGVQLEGNDNPLSTVGSTRPGIELLGGSKAIWIQAGCSFSSLRCAILTSGDLAEVQIQNNWFNGNNSHRTANTHPNINITSAGNPNIVNCIVSGNTFESDASALVETTPGTPESAVSHHVLVGASTGTVRNNSIIANVFDVSGTVPQTAPISLPATGWHLGRNVGLGAVCVVSAASVAVTDSSPILFATEALDPAGYHSTASNTNRITIDRAGWFRVSTSGYFEEVATSFCFIDVMQNGVTRLARCSAEADPGNRLSWNVSIPVLVAAGDYIDLFLRHDKGSAMTLTTVTLAVEPL